ncbi:MAG: Ppx/GppA phosphatase family protein [Candidatus Nanopelagicales bacterium]
MRLGVLDVGSNSVHLLVVDAHYGAAPVPAHSHKIELRLAENSKRNGNDKVEIAPKTVDKLSAFVDSALKVAEDQGVTEILTFATSAIREAENGDQVLDIVAEQTGLSIEVLDGVDEARLTYLAARRWYGWSSGRITMFDIGGGSLEIATGVDEDPDVAESMPLGAGHLTREFLSNDPPTDQEVKELRKHIRAEVAHHVGPITKYGQPQLAVASSKTFRQLARVTGAAPSAEGIFVPRDLKRRDLKKWLPKLTDMTAKERSKIPGVSENRAQQLVAGALVADAVMELFDVPVLSVCPWALREGVILRRLDGISE